MAERELEIAVTGLGAGAGPGPAGGVVRAGDQAAGGEELPDCGEAADVGLRQTPPHMLTPSIYQIYTNPA